MGDSIHDGYLLQHKNPQLQLRLIAGSPNTLKQYLSEEME
jgi:hypothetical protein